MSLSELHSSVCLGPVWGRFLKALSDQGIKQKQLRWYAYRVEQYLKSVSEKSLSRLAPSDLTGYLSVLGKSVSLTDWQYLQAVDSLRLFFLFAVKAPWAREFDWSYWKDSARSLNSQHPTVAREAPLLQAKEKPDLEPTPLDRVRAQYPDLIRALITEIRRRQYSIRTEQAYEQWVCRFSAHFAGRDPHQLGGQQIKQFLEHLAVQGQVAASTQNQALNALVFLYKQAIPRGVCA